MPAPTTIPGYVNRNKQRTDGCTGLPGSDHLQYVYRMTCLREVSGNVCGHVYGANGSDIHCRKCPRCQGGAAGEPLV